MIGNVKEELDEDSTKSEFTILPVPYAQMGGGWYKIKSLLLNTV